MEKSALKRFAIKIVIGFRGSSRVCILDEKKPFANPFGVDREMNLETRRAISIEISTSATRYDNNFRPNYDHFQKTRSIY